MIIKPTSLKGVALNAILENLAKDFTNFKFVTIDYRANFDTVFSGD